jgi:hypothetical protein
LTNVPSSQSQAWCEEVGFRPGDPRYLPYDWVDEGKLLLFATERVVNRAPRTGPRLVAERKRKRERERAGNETAVAAMAAGAAVDAADTAAGASKRRRGGRRRGRRHDRVTEASEEAEDAEDAAAQQLIAEQAAADRSAAADADAGATDDGDEDASDLVLQYNTVRGYISAINELWEHQTAHKLHSAPKPYRVAIKVGNLSFPLYVPGSTYQSATVGAEEEHHSPRAPPPPRRIRRPRR